MLTSLSNNWGGRGGGGLAPWPPLPTPMINILVYAELISTEVYCRFNNISVHIEMLPLNPWNLFPI